MIRSAGIGPSHGKQSRHEDSNAHSASSSTRPRSPAAGSAPRRSRSSTGSPPRAPAGGRSSRSTHPTSSARRTRRRRRSPPGRSCSASPTTRCPAPRRGRSPSATRAGSRTGWRSPAGDALADQVRFDREWQALRAYARRRGIRIIGDVPIYVAVDGCDHRAHPELFQPGRRGRRRRAAGRPQRGRASSGATPSTTGTRTRRDGYRWWIARMRRALELADVFRIDHFRGFAGYWAVPAGEETARHGHWEHGARRGALPRRRGRARPAAGDRRGSRA